MYGWRARIGVMVPATNATAENEYRNLAQRFEGVSVHVARVPGERGPVAKDWEVAFGRDCAQTAFQIRSVSPDVVVVANTSGTFINAEGDIAKSVEQITGVTTITTACAVVSSLRLLNAQRIGLVTPYPQEFNQYLMEYLADNKIETADLQTNTTQDIGTIGRYAPSEAYRLACKLNGRFDAIFISCTDFRSIEVLPLLEADKGVPAISSNLAAFTEGVKAAGVGLPNDEFRLWKQGQAAL